jgi:hypothetical protein
MLFLNYRFVLTVFLIKHVAEFHLYQIGEHFVETLCQQMYNLDQSIRQYTHTFENSSLILFFLISCQTKI